MFTIIQSNIDDRKKWDEYIHQHSDATPYHLFAWGQCVEHAYGFEPIYFTAKQEENIVGLLPIVIMSIPLKGKVICSLPYCDRAGILANNNEISEKLLNHVIEFSKKHGIKRVELRNSSDTNSIQDIEGTNEQGLFRDKKVSMLMSLPLKSEELLAGFKSKLRSQIKKSQKNGLTVAVQKGDNVSLLINDFYKVFSNNMRALGSPVHSKTWFEGIANNYDAIVCVVYLDSQPIGAGIVIRTDKKASIPWASTIQSYNSLSPNMLLYWSLLEHCSDNGIEQFDFGRSTFGEGTYKFKKQWGAEAVRLEWVNYQNGTAIHDNDKKNTVQKIRLFIEAVWRKTPLGVTIVIGPKIRKYISL